MAPDSWSAQPKTKGACPNLQEAKTEPIPKGLLAMPVWTDLVGDCIRRRRRATSCLQRTGVIWKWMDEQARSHTLAVTVALISSSLVNHDGMVFFRRSCHSYKVQHRWLTDFKGEKVSSPGIESSKLVSNRPIHSQLINVIRDGLKTRVIAVV